MCRAIHHFPMDPQWRFGSSAAKLSAPVSAASIQRIGLIHRLLLIIKKWIEKTFEFWKEFHNSRLLWTKKSVDCNILCCIFNYVPYPIVSAVPNTPHNYFDIISNVFISFSTLCKLTLF
jgi:hypothetical protein